MQISNTKERPGIISGSACALLIAVVMYSNFFDLTTFGSLARTVLIALIGALAIWGIVYGLIVGETSAAAVSTFCLLTIWSGLFIFAQNTGQSPNYLAGGMYYAGALAALFAVDFRKGRGLLLFRLLYRLGVIYAVLYTILFLMYQIGVLNPNLDGDLWIVESGESARGPRLFLAAPLIFYSIFVDIEQLRTKREFWRIWLLVLYLFVVYLSGGRGNIVVAAAVILLSAVITSRALQAWLFATLSVFLLVYAVTAGFGEYNPFDVFERTQSAFVRQLSVQVVQRLIPQYWLLGAGVPWGGSGYVYLTSSVWFYTSDIGVIGILFSYGIVGLCLYIILCVMAVAVKPSRFLAGNEELDRAWVSLCGTFVLYSFQGPLFVGGSGGIFASLAMAMCFARVPLSQR
jgi:hypothetical protein